MIDAATIERPRRPVKTVDRDRSFPLFVSTIANKISRGGSRVYLRMFGIGIIEWRILYVLAGNPDATAQAVCNKIDLDKAAASRSLQVLERLGYVMACAHPSDARKRTLALTAEGRALHDRILPVSVKRVQHLLQGFTDAERELLLNMLRRMQANAIEMDSRDYSADQPGSRVSRPRRRATAQAAA
jgi:DNA-binding MarR family transcriptional regulator